MDWKNALLYSRATFQSDRSRKPGAQPIGTGSKCFRHYPYEFNDLMQFLDSQRINGVISSPATGIIVK